MPEVVDTRRRNLVVAAVLLAMLPAALDRTIVSTALPTMVADLGAGAHLSWVVTSYPLAETIVSAALFLAGSFFAGWPESTGVLIASRAVQGLGAGALVVTPTAIIADVVPLGARARRARPQWS